MTVKRISARKYTPKSDRDSQLFLKVIAMIDMVTEMNCYQNLDQILHKYNINSDAYNPLLVLEEMGGKPLLDVFKLGGGTTEADKEGLVNILKSFFRIKGTLTGIEVMFSLLNIPIRIESGFRMSRERHHNTDVYLDYYNANDLESAELDECQVLITVLEYDGEKMDLLEPAVYAALLDLLDEYTYVCSDVIDVRVGDYVFDRVDVGNELDIDLHLHIFSSWLLNNPDNMSPDAYLGQTKEEFGSEWVIGGNQAIGGSNPPLLIRGFSYNPNSPNLPPNYPPTYVAWHDEIETDIEMDPVDAWVYSGNAGNVIGTMVIGSPTAIINPENVGYQLNGSILEFEYVR